MNAKETSAPRPEPEPQRGHGQHDHHRYEHPGDPVGEPLRRRLAALRLLDQSRDLCQLGVGPDPCSLDHQPAVGADRPTDDGVARPDLDRDRLPGHAGDVDRAVTADHHAIGGHRPARSDQEDVTDAQPGSVDHRLPPSRRTVTCAGRRATRPTQRSPRPALGSGLQVPPDQEERGDTHRRLEVQAGCPAVPLQPQLEGVGVADLTGRAEQQRVGRPAQRGQRAERDQGVHAGGALDQVARRRGVEGPAGPADHRHAEQQAEPLPSVELPRRHHGQHDHRQAEHGRYESPPTQHAYVVVGIVLPVAGQARAVTGPLDRLDQRLRCGRPTELHRGLLGGVVDGRVDPLDPVPSFFSIRVAQDAQVIPLTSSWTDRSDVVVSVIGAPRPCTPPRAAVRRGRTRRTPRTSPARGTAPGTPAGPPRRQRRRAGGQARSPDGRRRRGPTHRARLEVVTGSSPSRT